MKRLFALMVVAAFLVGLSSSPVMAGDNWATEHCKDMQETWPQWFDDSYKNLGDCVSNYRARCVTNCKFWRDNFYDDFILYHDNLGSCVRSCSPNNYCPDYCKWWQETYPDDFALYYKNLGDCVSDCAQW